MLGCIWAWRRVNELRKRDKSPTGLPKQLSNWEGDDNMAIRLGGIYALERIAKDSEKDHGPIMEVLTAQDSFGRGRPARGQPDRGQAVQG